MMEKPFAFTAEGISGTGSCLWRILTHLVGDAGDEGLDVQVGGAALLAGGICTFEASVGGGQD